MDTPRYGNWVLKQFTDGKFCVIDQIQNVPDDYWGDDLYDFMMVNGYIDDLDDYDVDGDSQHVAVMPKKEGYPEFSWDFFPYAHPNRDTSDCHTFS